MKSNATKQLHGAELMKKQCKIGDGLQIRQALEIPGGYPEGNRPGFTVLVLLQAASRCTVYLSVAPINKKTVAIQAEWETFHIFYFAGKDLQIFRNH